MRRLLALIALIVAGEAVFFLPFVVARIFRPTLLEVLGITNFQLGVSFSVYGVVAMVSYFPGGPIADRFPARGLMASSLVATALGGVLFATGVSFTGLKWLYGFWGITTILLFWAALIRATREWGGEASQGKAFGFLDGGRGLFTAIMGTVMVTVFSSLLPENVSSATTAQMIDAFRKVIWIFVGLVLLAAALVWVGIGKSDSISGPGPSRKVTAGDVKRVLGMPVVWLQALILVCAYAGFKTTDNFSLFAKDVMGMNDVEAARAGTVSLWTRPLAAILGGILADRFGSLRMTMVSFLLLLIGSAGMAAGFLGSGDILAFFATMVIASAGIYALRGLYFAIMEEGNIPIRYTGCAVGTVSVLGYTPEVFMAPVMGLLLDNYPGELGHRYVFALVAVFSALGMAATVAYKFAAKRAV